MINSDLKIIHVYGTSWCGDCLRTKSFLSRRNIKFEWINIDYDTEGEKIVYQINHGVRSVPTVLFPDGSSLVEPTNQDLEAKILQLQKGAFE